MGLCSNMGKALIEHGMPPRFAFVWLVTNTFVAVWSRKDPGWFSLTLLSLLTPVCNQFCRRFPAFRDSKTLFGSVLLFLQRNSLRDDSVDHFLRVLTGFIALLISNEGKMNMIMSSIVSNPLNLFIPSLANLFSEENIGDTASKLNNYSLKFLQRENGSKLNLIGSYAFLECTALGRIDIPPSVTSIGSSCLKNCEKLTSIILSRKCCYSILCIKRCNNTIFCWIK